MAKDPITEDMLIAEVMEKYPATAKVFQKHFGGECFTCPGSKNEDIHFGSTMHNADKAQVLRELNDIARKKRK